MSRKQASIQLKLAKAKSLLDEVPVLLAHQFYNTAVNRAYYACFHATKALLLTKDVSPKTHSGVVHQLHLHFVKNGLFHADQAAFFSNIMHERIEDDYNDEAFTNPDAVQKFVESATAYVTYIETLIPTPEF